ncbi:MAG: hypothetical protein V7K98_04695 [Nostoc sp.]|uniref:beta strand repeat-containing protein n=1 Tax=Nostoc sp. TaxID=1180 RepID=UPI002FF46754
MATFTVTNTNNSGAGSLRQEILDANALSGKDIINFCGVFDDGLAHTISLTGGGLSITDDITIQGINPNLLTISGNSASRVFDITSGVTATINGLTITNSYNAVGGGGGISNEGVLTLNNSIITGNTVTNNTSLFLGLPASDGGGIFNTGNLTVNYSIISNNSAGNGLGDADGAISSDTTSGNGFGGGIFNTGNLTVNYSTISDNLAAYGGGISVGSGGYLSGTITLNNSYISRNTARVGGAIDNSITQQQAYGGGDTIIVNNSLITNNYANNAGGIYNAGNITLNNSTISYNTATLNGGGIYNVGIDNPSFSRGVPGVVGYGSVTAINSNISNNSATSGGGIYNRGTLSVSSSNIWDNHASNDGGGIYNISNSVAAGYLGLVTVSYSTISDNTADIAGGGIYNAPDLYLGKNYSNGVIYKGLSILSVSNSTIADNQAHFGAGIYNGGTLTVEDSAIKYNKAFGIELSSGGYEFGDGAGIYNNSNYGTTTVYSNVIACNFDTCQEDSNNPIQPDDIAGNFINNGYNWIGVNTATTTAGDAA